ncbi:hypothetical protein AVEN_79793-1 [Araneus ventricosus]|uniref:Uncharacterized protein n=1 Tax=Araneus ventricosus TaxID=182803 RepID=A0A4Y2FZG1_ARAVE|nr:hypothetical protein AVEN_79793-1 [Araneus ventricosus]
MQSWYIITFTLADNSEQNSLSECLYFILNQFGMYTFITNSAICFNFKEEAGELTYKDGSKHVWNTISRSRYLSQDLKDVVTGVICRNPFFAHPENILLCMLKDERPYIRELAARRIIKFKE